MNYEEAIQFLYTQTASYQQEGSTAYKADLKNIEALCDFLNDPQNDFKSIHVAGTNGKGSTTHILSSILIEHGYKVGSFTSPHYVDFRERICINGQWIDEESVIAFVELIAPVVPTIQPSFFELTFALAAWYFSTQQIDIAVIEVGLGGRLDSTNIIHPLLSIITNIGLDHQAILGDTLQDIAMEKAGIIKQNTPVVIGKTQQETESIFKTVARNHQSSFTFSDQCYQISFSSIDFKRKKRGFAILKGDKKLAEATTDLLGDYQKENIRTAYTACQQLKQSLSLDEPTILRGIERVKQNTNLTGRWEVLKTEPLIIADSCHNAEAVEQFLEQILAITHDTLHIIYGCVSDKQVPHIKAHFPADACIYLTQPTVQRKMPVEELSSYFDNQTETVQAFFHVNDALKQGVQQAHQDDIIVVIGSIFLIGELKEF